MSTVNDYKYTNNTCSNSRPVTPSEQDCCGNGCNYCIFDVYKKLKEDWIECKTRNIKLHKQRNVLSLTSYVKFVVNNVKYISEKYLLVCLKCKDNLENGTRLFLNPGQHIILSPGPMSRAFTPISWTEDSLLLLIKLYLNGKFSAYVRTVNIGDEVNVRGPYGDFQYESNKFKQVIMFSMGSGIAAVYPIAKMITDNEDDETKVYLVAGFPTVNEIPLKKELQHLSDFWNFTCTIFISQQQAANIELHGINLIHGRLKKENVYSFLEQHRPDTTLVLICGTNEYNQSLEEWVKELNYIYVHVFK